MKSTISSFVLALVALFTFGTAQAQNAHFTDVIISEDGLTISGKVAGLGNTYAGQTITIAYGASVTVTKVCLTPNPEHQNIVPGQSGSKNLTTNGQLTVPGKNGNVTFTLTLDSNEVPVLDCQGRGLILDVDASSVTVGAKTLSFSVENKSGVSKTGSLTL